MAEVPLLPRFSRPVHSPKNRTNTKASEDASTVALTSYGTFTLRLNKNRDTDWPDSRSKGTPSVRATVPLVHYSAPNIPSGRGGEEPRQNTHFSVHNGGFVSQGSYVVAPFGRARGLPSRPCLHGSPQVPSLHVDGAGPRWRVDWLDGGFGWH